MTRNVLAGLVVAMIMVALATVAMDLPAFGEVNAPAQNDVYSRYVETATRDTGSVNSVTAVVFDYRGYDTLGEATVLFSAAAAAASVLAGKVADDHHDGAGRGDRKQTASRREGDSGAEEDGADG